MENLSKKFIDAVQKARDTEGYEKDDRIDTIHLRCDDEIRDMIKANIADIKEATLTDWICSCDCKTREKPEYDVDGHSVGIKLERHTGVFVEKHHQV